MQITYDKQYKQIAEGYDWTLYSDVNSKDSLIVWQLLNRAKEENSKTFDKIHTELRELYKNRTVKSSCFISKEDNRIEITTKGVFPRFYIEKK